LKATQSDEIREHLARLTSSEFFAQSERLCRFLRFTVECKLTGQVDQVKEYVIGREVFDRGEDYDPRLDPIVRVEARRLRSRLIEYYDGPGRTEPLRLEYPKGGYLPLVRTVQLPDAPSTMPATAPITSLRTTRTFWVAGVAGVALIATIGAFVASGPPSPVVLAPIPTTWIEPNDGSLEQVDVALAEDLDAFLANQPAKHVIAWPEIVRKKSLRFLGLRDFASQLGANRLLLILVRDQGSSKLVRVFAVDEPTGRKSLALTYTVPSLSTFAQQNALAARIAADTRP
jgi:hypothetical protein